MRAQKGATPNWRASKMPFKFCLAATQVAEQLWRKVGRMVGSTLIFVSPCEFHAVLVFWPGASVLFFFFDSLYASPLCGACLNSRIHACSTQVPSANMWRTTCGASTSCPPPRQSTGTPRDATCGCGTPLMLCATHATVVHLSGDAARRGLDASAAVVRRSCLAQHKPELGRAVALPADRCTEDSHALACG